MHTVTSTSSRAVRIEVAQQLARKADAWAVGLLLAGIASLATVVGFLIVVVGAFRSTNVLMSTTEVFTMRGTTGNLEVVVFGFLLALGGAFVVGRACERERRTGAASALLARLSHGKALVAGLAGLVALPYATFRAFAPMYLAALRRRTCATCSGSGACSPCSRSRPGPCCGGVAASALAWGTRGS